MTFTKHMDGVMTVIPYVTDFSVDIFKPLTIMQLTQENKRRNIKNLKENKIHSVIFQGFMIINFLHIRINKNYKEKMLFTMHVHEN